MAQLKGIIERIEKERLYKGKGGEIVRTALCHLIYAMAVAKLQFSQTGIDQLLHTMQENFKHPNQEIQDEAAKALHRLCATYFANSAEACALELSQNSQIVLHVRKMFTPSMGTEQAGGSGDTATTRGFNMAFGVLSRPMLKLLQTELIDVLLKNCVPKGIEADDAETRK